MVTPVTCSFIKANKERCQANCLKGRRMCWFHDPSTRSKHIAAAVKGANASRQAGVAKPGTLPQDTPDSPLKDAHDVREFISQTLNQLRTGKLATSIALAIFQGSAILLKSIDASIIEDRIAALEQRQQPRSK